jgi:hypothetical protein
MSPKTISVLRTLRIIESNSTRVSLSNLAVIVILFKIAISPFDWATAAGLLFALISYQSKKVINKKVQDPNESEARVIEIKEKLESMESKVSALSVQSGIKGLR